MINWNRINDLTNDIGAENIDEVIEVFLEEVEDVLATLKADCSMNDLRHARHFLRGSAMNLGFDELGKLCTSEDPAGFTNVETAAFIGKMKSVYDASKTEFLSGLR